MKYFTSSIRHGGGNVMPWTCMAAHLIRLLVFIGDMTADRSRRKNSEVYRGIL